MDKQPIISNFYFFHISRIVSIFQNKIYFVTFLFFSSIFSTKRAQEIKLFKDLKNRKKSKKQEKSEIKQRKT